MLTHPEIEDAAVIGLPNIEAGELPMAFIVKSSDSTLTEKDVEYFVDSKEIVLLFFYNKNIYFKLPNVLYLLGQVSAQKRLRGGVQFVNSIPKNPSGKILRRALKDLITKSKL